VNARNGYDGPSRAKSTHAHLLVRNAQRSEYQLNYIISSVIIIIVQGILYFEIKAVKGSLSRLVYIIGLSTVLQWLQIHNSAITRFYSILEPCNTIYKYSLYCVPKVGRYNGFVLDLLPFLTVQEFRKFGCVLTKLSPSGGGPFLEHIVHTKRGLYDLDIYETRPKL